MSTLTTFGTDHITTLAVTLSFLLGCSCIILLNRNGQTCLGFSIMLTTVGYSCVVISCTKEHLSLSVF